MILMFCKDIGSSLVINYSIHFYGYDESCEIKFMPFLDGFSLYYTPDKYEYLSGVFTIIYYLKIVKYLTNGAASTFSPVALKRVTM